MVPALASDSSARSLTSGSDSEGNPFTTPSHLRSASLNNGSGYFGAQPPQISQPRTPGSLSRKSSMKRSGSMPVYARSPSMSFLGPSFIAEKQRPIFKSQLLDEAATTEKPWLQAKSPKPGRISYGLFLAGVFLGIAGGAYILYTCVFGPLVTCTCGLAVLTSLSSAPHQWLRPGRPRQLLPDPERRLQQRLAQQRVLAGRVVDRRRTHGRLCLVLGQRDEPLRRRRRAQHCPVPDV